MIDSLLDTDFYKFSMQMAVLHQFPNVHVEYAFKCRNKDIVWTEKMVRRIQSEINYLCSLRFKRGVLDYLSSIRFLKPDYVDFLRLMQLNPDHVSVNLIDGKLDIRIKGSWLLTILFEVPVLAIVNEIYNEETHGLGTDGGEERLIEKIKLIPLDLKFSDFGTRRRFSASWHRHVVETLAKSAPKGTLLGTSNVQFAREFGLKPIGTMAHEFIQCGQAIGVRLIDSQKRMLQSWVDEYRGDLGYALTDTLGIDAFLRDFDLYFAKLYDGLRQDSGDPIEWGNKVLAHYEKLGIDPKTKYLVFSDSLDIPKAIEINNEFKSKTRVSFGIGTNLTNDIPGVTPLNVVIKVVKCNGSPVAKLSDSPGKIMCEDENYVNYLKSVFQIKE
jgi:nicotinate phosphoribosyltransferase